MPCNWQRKRTCTACCCFFVYPCLSHPSNPSLRLSMAALNRCWGQPGSLILFFENFGEFWSWVFELCGFYHVLNDGMIVLLFCGNKAWFRMISFAMVLSYISFSRFNSKTWKTKLQTDQTDSLFFFWFSPFFVFSNPRTKKKRLRTPRTKRRTQKRGLCLSVRFRFRVLSVLVFGASTRPLRKQPGGGSSIGIDLREIAIATVGMRGIHWNTTKYQAVSLYLVYRYRYKNVVLCSAVRGIKKNSFVSLVLTAFQLFNTETLQSTGMQGEQWRPALHQSQRSPFIANQKR